LIAHIIVASVIFFIILVPASITIQIARDEAKFYESLDEHLKLMEERRDRKWNSKN